ncbi:MAN2 [Lepeophtheirus salmonis]|uniref:MAN2 n=1 Tax=Lepeophtheirus salmonis TaxID=72036 RepID=A0A7R8CYU6_LEPSM|nr:MAN2 [Lepeophtheirus salmonis]CAF2971709.1 MAN2 [Lepeophtheirus salmonis]
MRRTKAILGSLVLACFLIFFYTLSQNTNEETQGDTPKINLENLEVKLKGLEHAIEGNERMLSSIKESINNLEKHQASLDKESNVIRSKGHSSVRKTFATIHKADLLFAQRSSTTTNISTLAIYEEIPFDNQDGGPWKQGWPITYSQSAFSQSDKLRVFVVPHSHNDPGWIKTFDTYFKENTIYILNNIVPKLTADPRRKFIWAEISFFSMWWNLQSEDVRSNIIKLLENGQFEIVTGGWVMNDEANTYYGAMIEQQISGHEWCKNNLKGYQPTFGWAIDPFGMTPTMAYLLKRMGFEGMLIQRTHYEVKKYLARNQNLEFKWRQHWDHESSTDMLTHMMPFYSYDIPHTCGPNPKICCQKKAQLYKTNVVLVPLGDDFRYDKSVEWNKQFDNYQKIFDYVNNNPELNAELKFGTLGDYFRTLKNESKRKTGLQDGLFPSLSGDFFTYADVNDNYWSGYYTSRPFFKNFDRVLGGYLRAAEIMFSMAWAEMMSYSNSDTKKISNPLMKYIVEARRSYNYGRRMSKSIKELQIVMSQVTHYLLTSSKTLYKVENENKIWFEFSEKADDFASLFSERVLETNGYDKNMVPFSTPMEEHVLFKFVVEVAALSLKSYYMVELKPEEGSNPSMEIANIRLYNTVKQPFQVKPFSDVGVFHQGAKFMLENGYVRTHFDENGILEAITTLDDKVKNGYGPAKTMRVESPIVEIIEGKLFSSVKVFLPQIVHYVRVMSSPGVDGTGLQIENIVDMRRYNNLEIAMRFDAAIDSKTIFYTDLNGFSMMERRRLSKIPLQANFYPIASMAYIQDTSSRLTLISRQPLGGSSLQSGQLEIMLDRRLMQDDNRGLGEPVTDNLITKSSFTLILERSIPSCRGENSKNGASYPSLLAVGARHALLNPLYSMFYLGEKSKLSSLSNSYANVERDLACDIDILNLRTSITSSETPTDSSAFIVHRQGFNGCYKPIGMNCVTNEGRLSLSELFPHIYSNNVQQMTLSLLYTGQKIEKSFMVSIKPMEMYTFILKH